MQPSAGLRAELLAAGELPSIRAVAGEIKVRTPKAKAILFRGPEARARKYASEELLEHWRTHPRPTEAMLEGRDTRVYELYSAPKRRGSGRRAA